MDARQTEVAKKCSNGAHEGTLDFPAIVRTLSEAGFEGYSVDYRRSTNTYFLPNGDFVELALHSDQTAVAAEFNAATLVAAIREAQTQAPGYTYVGFCSKVKAAGCAGYMVSFLGKRVLYFGRTAETHVEHFPK